MAAETAILERLAGGPLPVPEPVLAAPDHDGGVALQVYRALPGRPGGAPAVGEGGRLGRFLALLHQPVPGLTVGAVWAQRRQRMLESGVRDALDATERRWVDERLERVLAAPGLDRPAAVCHRDLSTDHLLLDSDGRLTGVIDFTDAGPDDPARDFVWWEEWGRTALDEALAAYGDPAPGLVERARIAADLAPLERMAHGLLEGGPADVEGGRAMVRSRMQLRDYPDR